MLKVGKSTHLVHIIRTNESIHTCWSNRKLAEKELAIMREKKEWPWCEDSTYIDSRPINPYER